VQKPSPEDFGIAASEYASLVEERARLREAIETAPGAIGEAFVEALLGTIFGTAFYVGLAKIAGFAISWLMQRLFQIDHTPTIASATAIALVILWLVALVFLWKEPLTQRTRLARYRAELSEPRYYKIETFEDAIRKYEYCRERYWISLRGVKFEKALGGLYEDVGYSVYQTKGSGDEGIDLVLRKDGEEIIVQCKGHRKPIGVAAIRDLYGVMTHCGAERAVLACPAGFTDGVRKFARGKPITLLSAKELVEMADSADTRFVPAGGSVKR
jgi:Restriction endonuclease